MTTVAARIRGGDLGSIPQGNVARDSSLFLVGGDFSFLQQEEAGGGVFRDRDIAGDPITIARVHGWNVVRLRIWHTPANGINDLAHTLLMASRVKTAGMRLLLDFHYSDWWADPGKQNKPSAWAGLTVSELAESVRTYTRDVLLALKNQGTPPEYVQPGNEISCGMLWPDGSVCGGNNDAAHWTNFTDFLKAGINGIHDVLPPDSVIVVVHSDRGGDFSAASWLFDGLAAANVQFDWIGLSYYPWWHGPLSQMADNVARLEARYHKPILIAETGYPWTLGWNDGETNIVGDSSQALPGYPASTAGQAAFLSKLGSIVRAVPNGHGMGVVYWEPDWISAPGFTSGGENLAFWDFNGNSLPAIDAIGASAVTIRLNEGWNLISNPVSGGDSVIADIFPNAQSQAFTFKGAYVAAAAMRTGSGYWLKSPADTVVLSGFLRFTDTVAVQRGWNLIGGLSVNIPAAALKPEPGLTLLPDFYGYESGYFVADTLKPGKGYWIKASREGYVILPAR